MANDFTLPTPSQNPDLTPAPPTVDLSLPEDILKMVEDTGIISTGPTTRDWLIAGGILLVLLVVFFFAKNAYANYLVSQRVPPNKANAAGWWLFIFLGSLSAAVILAAINTSFFLVPLYMGPLGAISLLSLILMLVTGRK